MNPIGVYRLKWMGHIWRAGIKSKITKLMSWQPGKKKRTGCLRIRWMDQSIVTDLRKLEVRNWKEMTENRKNWTELAEKMKRRTKTSEVYLNRIRTKLEPSTPKPT